MNTEGKIQKEILKAMNAIDEVKNGVATRAGYDDWDALLHEHKFKVMGLDKYIDEVMQEYAEQLTKENYGNKAKIKNLCKIEFV